MYHFHSQNTTITLFTLNSHAIKLLYNSSFTGYQRKNAKSSQYVISKFSQGGKLDIKILGTTTTISLSIDI